MSPGRTASKHEWLAFYKSLAKKRGGKCLSRSYASAHEKLKWRCAGGHTWFAVPNGIKHGRWCPECADLHRHDIKKAKTFAKVKKVAQKRGGRCVSTDYVDNQTHLRWGCGDGHEWEAVPASIANGTWCPYCAGKHVTIDDMRELAEERSGKCLSRRYVNGKTKLRWRCKDGHTWNAIPDNVTQGKWCPYCAGTMRKTLENMQTMAGARGGECLSKRYVDVATKLQWRCAAGHVFWMNPNAVQQGQWCPTCRKVAKDSLERIQAISKRHKGECLSRRYVDSFTPLRFQCRHGHRWKAPPNGIVQGSWCPTCAKERTGGRKKKLTIGEMRELAASRGGRCLSKVYVNSKTKLKWRCFAGHEWEATPASVKHRSWCPRCAHRYVGTLGGMQALAVERGGRCLSRHYDGHQTELDFVCERRHRFRISGREAKTGVWCPQCA